MQEDVEIERDSEEIEENVSKIEKVKVHLKKNKKHYIAFGGAVVIGVVAGVITRRPMLVLGRAPMLEGGNFIMHRPIFKKSPVYHITNHFGAPYNRLSRVIQCVETGEITVSIAQMARLKDSSASQICQHLNYPELYPQVKGLTYKSLGYTQPSEVNWALMDASIGM